jgi:hypothetical protein
MNFPESSIKQAAEPTHSLLINLGFVNDKNTIPFPCYSHPRLPKLLITPTTKLECIADILEWIYKAGFASGQQKFQYDLADYITKYEKNNS